MSDLALAVFAAQTGAHLVDAPRERRFERFLRCFDEAAYRSMLAERVMEWTEQWKNEGLEQGREQALGKSRGILLQGLEKRFGPLPGEIRRQVDAIGSIEELMELGLRVGTAASLEDLKLS